MSEKPIEPPSPVAIARALCGLTAHLRADINFERMCLEEAGRLLSEEPPAIDKARSELEQGLAHAFRDLWREEGRPEAWLVAACAKLLSTA